MNFGNTLNKIMTNQKIMIVGVPTAGKTTLIKLLDGHSNLRTVHTHDQILKFFYTFNNNKKVINEHVKKFRAVYLNYNTDQQLVNLKIDKNNFIEYSAPLHRYILNNYTNYYNTESWSKMGCLPSETTSADYQAEKFIFDFSEFENRFFNKIFKHKDLTSEEYIDIYYDIYFSVWKQYSFDNNNYLTVFFGPNDIKAAEYVLKENYNIKVIFYSRDIVGRVISNSMREFRYLKNKSIEHIILSDISKNSSKSRIVTFNKKVDNLIQDYRLKIFITDFNKITFDTKNEMLKIIRWLDLEFIDILTVPTLAGMHVSKKYLSISNDEKLLKSSYIYVFLQFYLNGFSFILSNKKMSLKFFYFLFKFFIFKIINFIKNLNFLRKIKNNDI